MKNIFTKLQTISGEELCELLSYETVEKKSPSDIIAYARSVEKKIINKGYGKNIQIQLLDSLSKVTPISLATDTKFTIYSGYRLKMSNIKIIISQEPTSFIFDRAVLSPYQQTFIENITPFTAIDFFKCEFINNNLRIAQGLQFHIGSFVTLTFKDCKFKKLAVFFMYTTMKDLGIKTINFFGNKFCEGLLSFQGEGALNLDDNDISIENSNNNKSKNNIESSKNSTSYLHIKNNSLSVLQICGCINAEFSGVNRIKEILIEPPFPNISWNPYQEILNESPHIINSHKTLFLELKKDAKRNEDFFQTIFFHNEVIKCEHEKIKGESMKIAYQEKFILSLSKFISNYGTSWTKPIYRLFILNYFSAFLILIFLSNNINWPYNLENLFKITFELFIPFKWYGEIINDTTYKSALFAFLNIMHKALYAALIYEIIKSFRRFAGK